MLQIKNLTITHKKDLRELIRGLSFTLNAGDKIAVIGEEGNGKSTLLKLIFDERLTEDYAEYTGEIHKAGLRLGYLSQELTPEQKRRTIYEFCADQPGFLDLSPREVADAAHEVGLPEELLYADRPVESLSGGERIKLQLACLLMEQPDALLLDEPSNDIDVETLEWLENFILSSEAPVLFVSHDETLIEKAANGVLHLELVRRKTLPRATIARIPYPQYIEERLNGLARQEQMARKEASEHRKQMEKYRQIFQRVEHEQRVISRQDPGGARLLKKKMKAVKSMGRRLEREREDGTLPPDVEEAILADFDESISLPSGKTVLDFRLDRLEAGERLLSRDIRLRITGPEKVVIIGRNGAGKTTLLRRIAQELLARPDLKAAYMPQNYEELLEEALTPVEFLAPMRDGESITRARTFLGSVKYTPEEMAHPISGLSGGQKAKLLFMKMILDGCNVLVLDEPTRNFSPLSNPVIRRILQAYGGAIISISHDRKYIAQVCDRVLRLTSEGLLSVEQGKE